MLINRGNAIGAAATAIPLVSSVMNAVAAQTASPTNLDLSSVKTAGQFAAQVIGRADLSRAASEIAVKKLTRADAKEFSGFELMEAQTVIAVLKDLGTPLPVMGPDAEATLNLIANAPEGNAFDKAYISARSRDRLPQELRREHLRRQRAAWSPNRQCGPVRLHRAHRDHVPDRARHCCGVADTPKLGMSIATTMLT